MIPSKQFLREQLYNAITDKGLQGYDIKGLAECLEKTADSYDDLIEFAKTLNELNYRSDWAYVEPISYEEIEKEMAEDRLECLPKTIDYEKCMKKAEAAFLGSVMGCILGKPIEVNPSYQELKTAGEKTNQWPINDYLTQEFMNELGRSHSTSDETLRENITYVASDDDINYSVLGMLNLEKHGLELDANKACSTWLKHVVRTYTFGPERVLNACITMAHLQGVHDYSLQSVDYSLWTNNISPNDVHCGAQIRADAYGYAFAGRPDLAAKYAYIDSSLSHSKTGVYSTMFTAAAIAGMFVAQSPMQAFKDALKFVPQNSRFAKMTQLCIDYVEQSNSFEEAYERINHRFSEFTHCGVFQETGTLINTMKYANDIWHGVCLQIMQGNDTDSYGCTIGSMLGAYYGYEKLDMTRLDIFNDSIRIPLAEFYEQSLSELAKRMGRLVEKFAE